MGTGGASLQCNQCGNFPHFVNRNRFNEMHYYKRTVPFCQVCELGEQLQQEKARCEGLVKQDRQEVNLFFQTLDGVLARKRQAYLEALDKAGAEVLRAYDPLIHRVKELQVCFSRWSQHPFCDLRFSLNTGILTDLTTTFHGYALSSYCVKTQHKMTRV